MKDLWKNDRIQFSRLIAECNAERIFTKKNVKKLCLAMNLEYEDDLYELIDRATIKFDKIKKSINRV